MTDIGQFRILKFSSYFIANNPLVHHLKKISYCCMGKQLVLTVEIILIG
jgi:hypothetical protein